MEHGPLLGQIFVQVSYAVMFLLSRVVLHQGMSQKRECDADDERCRQDISACANWVVLAMRRITISQNLYYSGLSLTSTTFATTMNNLNPASTYLMALVFKMEKLSLSNWGGRAKILGTAICVFGATLMTLFKGPVVLDLQIQRSETSDRILGALLLFGGVWTWSLCLIYQAWITLDCTSQLASTAVMCWMGALQSGLVALLFVRTPGAWSLSWDLQLLTITYSGIFCSAIAFFVLMWCVKKKGPLFASIFSPLSNVIVAILEPLLLRVPLRWGSFIGMVLVIGGLYCVLWGKASEEKADGQHIDVTSGAKETLEESLLIHDLETNASDAN